MAGNSNREDSRRGNRRTFLKSAGITGAVLASGLSGCIGSITGGDSGPYTVGSVQPLSGGLAPWGSQYNKRGMEMALEKINEVQINGRDLQFSVEDTATSPETGVSAAQKLVNQEGVPLLMGAVSSGVTMAIARSVSIPNNVVQVTNNSTSPQIADLEDDRYVLRTAPNDAAQGKAIAQLTYDEGVRKASIIYINNDFGESYRGTMGSAFKELGGSVVSEVPYEQGKSNYEAQLSQAMEGDPDGIIFIAYPEGFLPMARQAFQMGIKDQVQYVGAHPLVSDPMREEIDPKTVNGMVGTRPSPPIGTNLYQEFESEFKETYDSTPLPWSAYTYDAVNLIALAIQKAGSFESQALRDAIYPVSRPGGTEVTSFQEGKEELEAGNEINYQGPSGTVNLNNAGDVPATYQTWNYDGGEFSFGDTISVSS